MGANPDKPKPEGALVGWNEIEYEGLNENFHNRGRRSEEQVEVMRALWAQPNV